MISFFDIFSTMTRSDYKLFKDIAKGMALLVFVLLVCGHTKGGGAILVAGAAFLCALTGRIGWAIIGYIFFPLLVVMNPFVVPKEGMSGMVLRLAPMAITVGLLVSGASRSGRHQIPIGLIWLYLFVAALCSMGGYYPEISYLKIVNCAILFIGLQLGFRNIDKRPNDVMTMRKFMLVITSFVVFGSIAVWVFFPGAAYVTSLRNVIAEQGMEVAESVLEESSGMKLFAGILNHSQGLAVILPCSLAWLACDMFFIEKRLSPFHILTILAGMPLIYMTRSRSAFLTSAVGVILIYFYCLKKVNIRPHIRARLRSAMVLAMFLVVVAAGVMEVRNKSISRWLRKKEDLSTDTRGFGEAFTSSRQGLIDKSMKDFRRNPLFGSGFQVSEEMQYAFRHQKGLILSASIEKGVLPVMVLGETGIMGAIAFVVFLISFYTTCVRKKYYCCATLHTIFLVTNMAEATYFSPGGNGGYVWVLTVGGGFIIDTVVLYHRRLAKIARQQQLEWMMMQQYSAR